MPRRNTAVIAPEKTAANRVYSTPELLSLIVSFADGRRVRPALAPVSRRFLVEVARLLWYHQQFYCSNMENALEQIPLDRKTIYCESVRIIDNDFRYPDAVTETGILRWIQRVAKRHRKTFPSCRLVCVRTCEMDMVGTVDFEDGTIDFEGRIAEKDVPFKIGGWRRKMGARFKPDPGLKCTVNWQYDLSDDDPCLAPILPHVVGGNLLARNWGFMKQMETFNSTTLFGFPSYIDELRYYSKGIIDRAADIFTPRLFQQLGQLRSLELSTRVISCQHVMQLLANVPPTLKSFELIPSREPSMLDPELLNVIIHKAYAIGLDDFKLGFSMPRALPSPTIDRLGILPKCAQETPRRFTFTAQLFTEGPSYPDDPCARQLVRSVIEWSRRWAVGLPLEEVFLDANLGYTVEGGDFWENWTTVVPNILSGMEAAGVAWR